jgi:hypothetical protein
MCTLPKMQARSVEMEYFYGVSEKFSQKLRFEHLISSVTDNLSQGIACIDMGETFPSIDYMSKNLIKIQYPDK